MLGSMFSAISGLRAHQEKMDVVGNNISNVNTVGYKKSRATFSEVLAHTLSGGASAQGGKGGTNPMQIGLGVTLGSIDVIHTQGGPQSTGKQTDMCIEGDGFFVLSDGQNEYYTRDGNFDFDGAGNFIGKSSGLKVKGYIADSSGNIKTDATTLKEINLSNTVKSVPAKATTTLAFSKNIDAALGATVDNFTGDASKTAFTLTNPSFVGTPVVKVNGAVKASPADYSIAGNVVTFIAAPAANDKIEIDYNTPQTKDVSEEIYDSLGKPHVLDIAFSRDPLALNSWKYSIKIDGTAPTTNATGTIAFDNTGKCTSPTAPFAVSGYTPTGAAAMTINVDLSKITQFASDFSVTPDSQDGYAAGNLKNISVDNTGTITGIFSNGQTQKLAQIALATFTNPAGLMKNGENLYIKSNNSGDALKSAPGVGSTGKVIPGSLEMSNVDLSQEFVDMITTQRGFQANSKVITTSDEMLQELVNLKR